MKTLCCTAALLLSASICQANGSAWSAGSSVAQAGSSWTEAGPSTSSAFNSTADCLPAAQPYLSGGGDPFYSSSYSSSGSGSGSAPATSADYTPLEASTYMDYDQAVALGNAAGSGNVMNAGGTGLSLGDVARQMRSTKASASPAKMVIRQADSGALEICNADATSCHAPR